MLQSLHIVNFAIVEDTWIELGPGVTVFTGETGSGKSILMDALAILLGRRASVDLIRKDKNFFRVEGIFSADSSLIPVLEEIGVDTDEEEIIISRKMNRNGRGVCTVNGVLCTVKQLEKLGNCLVRLHEQNDNTELLSPQFCRYLVDHSDNDLLAAWNSYRHMYDEWKTVKDSIEKFQQEKQAQERRLDILKWEIGQIEQAQIHDADEDSVVRSRLTVLENHEKICIGVYAALEALSGEAGVQNKLAEAINHVVSLGKYDASFSSTESELNDALYAIEDAISELGNYTEASEFSEKELADLQTRDNLLSQLKNKYGPTLSDVLSYLDTAKKEYEQLYDMLYDNEHIQEYFQELTQKLQESSRHLNALRCEKGTSLCQVITDALHDMNMDHAVLAFHLEESEVPSSSGAATMEFYFSANPGEPLRPMRQTASGGEISRISLGVEDIMAHLFSCQTLVFDEIDTGISGSTALRVAKKIGHLARTVQILCITHMPQTASIADIHYRIQKTVVDGRTITRAVRLSEDEHIMDVAWMISGSCPPNESAVQSARELKAAVQI